MITTLWLSQQCLQLRLTSACTFYFCSATHWRQRLSINYVVRDELLGSDWCNCKRQDSNFPAWRLHSWSLFFVHRYLTRPFLFLWRFWHSNGFYCTVRLRWRLFPDLFGVALYIKLYLPIDGVEKSLIFLFCLVDPVRTEIKTLQSKVGSFDVNVYRSTTHMTGTTLAPADSRVFTYEAAI